MSATLNPPIGFAEGLARAATALDESEPALSEQVRYWLRPVRNITKTVLDAGWDGPRFYPAHQIGLALLARGEIQPSDVPVELAGELTPLEAVSLFTLTVMEEALGAASELDAHNLALLVTEGTSTHMMCASSFTASLDLDVPPAERSAASATLWAWSRDLSKAATLAGRHLWADYLDNEFMY
jgi:hypothetical protein